MVVGATYSAFQSTATSNGTITFAVNGHQGTFTLSNTKVESYNIGSDTTTVFTLISETGYTAPVITAITMNSVALNKTAACDVYLEYAIIAGKSVDWITLYDGTNNSIGGDSGHKDGTSYSFIPHEDSIDWYSLDLTDIYVSAFDN